jgi:ABC-type nitrate/sulfonate/bicarbonate transport system substrate-binding protein
MEGMMRDPVVAEPNRDSLVRNLQESTRRLSRWLDGLQPRSCSSGNEANAATPEQMSGLLSELLQAGEWLRSRPTQADAALESEVAEYRKQVVRLRELLPSIHAALLRERAALERERERVKSAGEWARVSRQTL